MYIEMLHYSNGNTEVFVNDKNLFSDQVFMLPLLMLTVESVKSKCVESLKSLHTIFQTYLDQMMVKFDQNCMVRTG